MSVKKTVTKKTIPKKRKTTTENTPSIQPDSSEIDNTIFRQFAKESSQGFGIATPDGKVYYVNDTLLKIVGEKSSRKMKGKTFLDYYPPEMQKIIMQTVIPEVLNKGSWSGELYLNSAKGNLVHTYENYFLIRDEAGAPAFIAYVLSDITQRKKNTDEIERKNALLDAINQIFLESITCKSDGDVASVCLSVAEELTESGFGFIGELNKEGLFDTIAISDPGWGACIMPKEKAVRQIQNMVVRGIWGKVISDRKPMITNDPMSHPDSAGVPKGHPKLMSFLGIPLIFKGKIFGMMALANKESGYVESDIFLAESLSVAFVEALMRKRADIALQESRNKLEKNVREKTKELRCLYEISYAMENEETGLSDLFQQIIRLIPPAWQVPEKTSCRLTYEEISYVTDSFTESPLKQQSTIKVNGKKAGSVEVFCSDKGSSINGNPFLKEEKDLLNTICDRIGKMLEHRKDKNALTESEKKYRILFENMTSGFAYHKIELNKKGEPADYIFLDANNTFEKFTRLKTEDIIGKRVTEIIPGIEKANPDLISIYGEVALTGKDKNFEVFFEPFNKWYSISVFSPEEGYFCTIFDDITLRKKAVLSLEENEKNLKLALKAAKAGTLLMDLATGTLQWDDRSLQIFGVDKKSFKSDYESWAKLVHPEDANTLQLKFEEDLEKADVIDFRYRIIRPDGNIRYIWAIANIVRDDKGSPVKLTGLHFDETEEKLAEEQLKSIQTQLRESIVELESSNKDLEQFAYVASHDLQEPLRMVTSYMNLVEKRYKDKLDEDGIEFIEYAVSGASRMQILINDLLVFSRVGTRGNEIVDTDINKIMTDVLGNLENIIEENNARITIDDLPEVAVDKSQFAQLIQNLISNAIKFRSQEPPEISISTKKIDDEWEFAVTDNGIGIDEEYSEKIFIIFQRLHPKEEYPGTGIGLAVCKKIVERHGGRIWLKSNPGKGTTFYFTIPERR